MKNFTRKDHLFSLCGLKCGLCTMQLDGYCPGCGGGAGNQGCAIARCSLRHGSPEYCFLCAEYLCPLYDNTGEYDSFITHRHQLKDLARAKEQGPQVLHEEIARKADMLKTLLAHYNSGRHKSFFCLAVNLLEMNDLQAVMDEIAQKTDDTLSPKEKTALAAAEFQKMAALRGMVLKLNKKPAK